MPEKNLEVSKMDVMEATLNMKGKEYSIALPLEPEMNLDEYEQFFEIVKQAMIKMVKREYFNFTGKGNSEDPWKSGGDSLCLKDTQSQ